MWYTSPGSASDWENTSLVIGNGKTGGILFGQVANDQIHFNEKTLWTGGPSESRPNYDGGNRDEAVTEEQLEALRQKMDDHSEAVFPQGTSTTTEVWGDGAGMGQYQDFGDLYLDFSAGGMTNDNVENYVRDLDMRTGISSVNYDYEGVHYEREYFASHPDHAVVTRLTASEAGKISFTASVRSASGLTTTTKAENGKITLAGEVNDNQMKCEMQAQIVNEGGTLTNNEDGTVTVENADAVTIVYSTDTDYKNEYPVYRTGESAEELSASLAETVDAAAAIELNSSYNDANAVYEARDTEEDWATYITTAADLKNQIDAAAALLAEEDCTVSELNAMKTAVDTAKDTLTGLWDRLTVTFTPESGQLEGEGLVTLSSEFDDLQIRYTTDGNDPMSFSALYEEPIAISGKQMTIKAALFSGVRRMSDVFTGVYDIGNERVNLALTAQEVTTSDNYDSAHDGWKAVDGNSYEPSRWATTDGTKEAQLELTFAEPVTVDGAGLIQYNMNTSDRNIITDFNIEYWDGEQWIAVIEGASMGNNGMQHEWSGNFEAVTSDRFRLNIVEGADPSVYEFELYKPVEIQSVETDKEILQSVISYAETAIENGQVDAAIEEIQKSFMEVYEYAVTVNENPSSSQDTIDRTWNAMLTELHKLGFFAGDKSGLQEHYNLYSALDLELYIDGAEKTAFIEALKTAENVLKDGNAMQEDVTAADQKLLDAAAALVLKADKTALQKLVDVASGYEEDNYLSTGWGTFENALANANEVLNDEIAPGTGNGIASLQSG